MTAFTYDAGNTTTTTSYLRSTPQGLNDWYTLTPGYGEVTASPTYTVTSYATPSQLRAYGRRGHGSALPSYDSLLHMTSEEALSVVGHVVASQWQQEYLAAPLPDQYTPTEQQFAIYAGEMRQRIMEMFAVTPQELGVVSDTPPPQWQTSAWSMTREIMDDGPQTWAPQTWTSETCPATFTLTTGNSTVPVSGTITSLGTGYFFSSSSPEGGTRTLFSYAPVTAVPQVDEYEQMLRIKQPLTDLMRKYPQIIPVLLQKIEAGKIDGTHYGNGYMRRTEACCIVGWVMRVTGIADQYDHQLSVPQRTVLENYIMSVHPGETHETNFRLKVLHYLLTELAAGFPPEEPEQPRKKRTSTKAPDLSRLLDDIHDYMNGTSLRELELVTNT